MQRILAAAAEHVRGHTVALAAALPDLLADAEPVAPLQAARRPAVPMASPFAATKPPAGLRSPSATPSKGSSGGNGSGSCELPSARRSSMISHAGHAQLLPSFDSEAGSAALGGGSHGAGSMELPAQDSQHLGFDRLDSVRMPSFSDNFRTVRVASLQADRYGDRFVASGLVFSSRRPSDLDSVSPMLPSFMPRRQGPAPADFDVSGSSRPAGGLHGLLGGSPAALARAGSSSTTQAQQLHGLGGIAGRESSHSLQHYLDDSQVRAAPVVSHFTVGAAITPPVRHVLRKFEGSSPPLVVVIGRHPQTVTPCCILLQDAALQQPRDVVIAPGMGCLFINPPAAPIKAAAAGPPPAAPAEPQADIDTAPRQSRLEALEVGCMADTSYTPGSSISAYTSLIPPDCSLLLQFTVHEPNHPPKTRQLKATQWRDPSCPVPQVFGLEAEGRSQSLGSAGSQSLSGFSIAAARTLSHGSATLESGLDSVASFRGRTSMESAPEVEAVWG